MDEGIEVVGFVCMVVLAVFGGVLLFADWSFDRTVVEACKSQGYWQTGQTRVKCAIDTPVNNN